MKPELKKRVITAAVGGAILLAVTLGLGYYGTAFFAVALALFMTHEYLAMILQLADRGETVSYTHLTLPTKRIV